MRKSRMWLLALPVAALAIACGGAPDATQVKDTSGDSSAASGEASAGIFGLTDSMGIDRQNHAATLLADGRVLVTGGKGASGGPSFLFHDLAELYDPASGGWSPTGSMAYGRADHIATLLKDGRVLAVGNKGQKTSPEVYDPSAGTWAPAGETAESRGEHTGTLLQDGRVLVAGGKNTTLQYLESTELYDPATGAWSMGPDMADERANHTATLLKDGKVLVVGSDVTLGHLTSVELYDPDTNTLSPTGSTSEGRAFHTATLLADGRVLVVGGTDKASTEIYDPSTGTWSSAGHMAEARVDHSAALLGDGRVLVLGGEGEKKRVAVWDSAELYDSTTNTWSIAATMSKVRYHFTATPLKDGSVLVVGGQGKVAGGGWYRGYDIWDSAELYSP